MDVDFSLQPETLLPRLRRFWELSGEKIARIEAGYDPAKGSPVFTVRGQYTTRGWTEWTQGFQYGSAILQFDATGDAAMLDVGRRNTVERMATHVSHVGVHDHGFNNLSTYGNLLRLMDEGRIENNPWERRFYELALKASGAVQARRWTTTDGGGYIYSFNGPHSLFVDTIRSLRVLAVAHLLGHVLMEENDRRVSLLDRLKQHAASTAHWSVYYGNGRDAYDVRGRVAHEAIFNVNDGNFRCPNSQQGYSPFSTWTRGLAWAMCGFAEELEFLDAVADSEVTPLLIDAALATCDFYIEQARPRTAFPTGTPAPELHRLGDWRSRPADPFNDFEPVDSSAAAIAAQGLLRLGRYIERQGSSHRSRGGVQGSPHPNPLPKGEGTRYTQAGLTVLATLLGEPYLSTDNEPPGADSAQRLPSTQRLGLRAGGRKVPCGESSMWGDYHAREVALLRAAAGRAQTLSHFLGES